MKTNSYFLLFCVLLGNTLCLTAKSNSSQRTRGADLFISNINNIIEDVLHRQWEDEESTCLQKTLDILRNVQNHTLWATWVWDSMQRPTGVLFGSRNQLGNFDECLYPPWAKTHPELKTQYCLADIVLTDKRTTLNDDPYTTTDLYLSSLTKLKLTVNKLTWGLCLPAICKPNSVKKITETFLSNSHLGFALPQATISIDSCQSNNEHTEVSYGYYATLGFIGSMILLTLLSTYYYENHQNTKKENFAFLIAKAFSIQENTAELFKVKDDEILCLNSTKFLTSYLVICVHEFTISYNIGYKDLKSFEHRVESNYLILGAHIDIIVDTYITISGILLIRSLLANDKPINFVNIVIKRYFRLSYLTMVIILFTTQLYHGSGPLRPKMIYREVETCRENWWTNLLMINNYMDFSKTCLPVTWSIACDFHLTILGTGLYWLYQKNKSLALKLFLICAIASVMLPTLVSYQQESSPVQFSDMEKLTDVRIYANTPNYLHSHLRSGPYFIGLALGFLFSAYKRTNKKLPKNFSIIVFSLGMGLGLLAFGFGGYLVCRKYSPIEAALYVGTNRSIWAIAFALIIISCEYGTVPLVADLLCWSGFIPLSKLHFGVYLTHWLVMTTKATSTMSPSMAFITYTMMDSVGTLALCCALSYTLWLVFEAPMNNVIAIMLRNSSNKKSKNETSRQNGVSPIVKKVA